MPGSIELRRVSRVFIQSQLHCRCRLNSIQSSTASFQQGCPIVSYLPIAVVEVLMASKEQEATRIDPNIVEYTKVAGYDTFNSQVQPPPYKELYPTPTVGEDKIFSEVKAITEEDAKLALLRECAKHKTWKKSAVEKMVITNINPSVTYYYVVESFCETRTTAYATEPYIGQPLDTPAMGSAPLPWDIQCFPANLFKDEMKLIEVPHTSNIQICAGCSGRRGEICFFCKGRGHESCFFCKGTGSRTMAAPSTPQMPMHVPPQLTSCNANSGAPQPFRGPPVHLPAQPRILGPDMCHHCHGHGTHPCIHCQSKGWKDCASCCGTGQQRSFVRMTVTYKVERSEFITDHGDIPAPKIKNTEAVAALDEQGVTIAPINNHSCADINRASSQFITDHNAKASQCRILQQRHYLKSIPTAAVNFSMPGSRDGLQFYVYGEQKNAYIQSYPSKCLIL